MKRVLLDTNVLVSFLTDRDPAQQKKAAELFAAAERGDVTLGIPQVVLTELVFVLLNLYRVAAADVAATVDELLALPGLAPIDELSWPLLRELWPQEIPAFGDAVVVSVAQAERYETIATFDLKLRRALRRRRLQSYF